MGLSQRNRSPAGPPPDDLTDYEKRLFADWLGANYPHYATRRHARRLVDSCLDHFRALMPHDRRRKKGDWLAACRNWVRKEADFHSEGSLGYRQRCEEQPQERGTRAKRMQDASELVGEASERILHLVQ